MKDPNSSVEAIHALSQAIAEAKDPKEIYNLILDAVVRFLKVEKASIMAYDPEAGVLRVIAARGMDEKMISNVVVRVGEGISGKVFASHKRVLIKELKAEETKLKVEMAKLQGMVRTLNKGGHIPMPPPKGPQRTSSIGGLITSGPTKIKKYALNPNSLSIANAY